MAEKYRTLFIIFTSPVLEYRSFRNPSGALHTLPLQHVQAFTANVPEFNFRELHPCPRRRRRCRFRSGVPRRPVRFGTQRNHATICTTRAHDAIHRKTDPCLQTSWATRRHAHSPRIRSRENVARPCYPTHISPTTRSRQVIQEHPCDIRRSPQEARGLNF